MSIVVTDNGRTCAKHRFRCGNLLLLAMTARGCGVLLHLRRTASPDELAVYCVRRDDSDGRRAVFTPREHAVGARGNMLNEVLVRVFEVFTPVHPNLHCRALYHRNHGYALAEMVDKDV